MLLCPEILDQALECFVVPVTVVPVGEVSDVTCAAKMCGPAILGIHHGGGDQCFFLLCSWRRSVRGGGGMVIPGSKGKAGVNLTGILGYLALSAILPAFMRDMLNSAFSRSGNHLYFRFM